MKEKLKEYYSYFLDTFVRVGIAAICNEIVYALLHIK